MVDTALLQDPWAQLSWIAGKRGSARQSGQNTEGGELREVKARDSIIRIMLVTLLPVPSASSMVWRRKLNRVLGKFGFQLWFWFVIGFTRWKVTSSLDLVFHLKVISRRGPEDLVWSEASLSWVIIRIFLGGRKYRLQVHTVRFWCNLSVMEGTLQMILWAARLIPPRHGRWICEPLSFFIPYSSALKKQ